MTQLTAYNKGTYYPSRLGLDRFNAVHSAGQTCVPPISFLWEGTTGNSRMSHLLLSLAHQTDGGTGGTQSAVLEAVLRGHFEERRDLSDREFLINTGAEYGGLDREVIRQWLDDEVRGSRVDNQVRKRREQGVRAVPSVILQDRFMFSGFQEPQVYFEAFERIRMGLSPQAGR